MIYMMRVVGQPEIKIGFALSATKRLGEMQVAHAKPVEIIRLMAGTQQDETALRRRFEESHVSGEWFWRHAAMFGNLGLPDLPIPPPSDRRAMRKYSDAGKQLQRQAAAERRVLQAPRGKARSPACVIVNALGGWNVVASLTGSQPHTVRAWYRIGIPAKFWPKLIAAAADRAIAGVTLETLAASKPVSI